MNARERGQMQKEYKFLKNCRRPMPLEPGTPAYLDTARYKLTFIPSSETPFSDDQIVIAIFQPDNS